MRRAALICIAMGMAVAASSLAAQQATQDEPSTASPQAAPPPFPHYPKAKPREHDPDYRQSTHKPARTASHHSTKTSHASKSPHASKSTHASNTLHSSKASHVKAKHQAKAQQHATREHFSKRTIRQCQAMTYKQIMSHEHCRTMMKQDLEAHAKKTVKHATHHSTAKHSAKSQPKKAHRSRH